MYKSISTALFISFLASVAQGQTTSTCVPSAPSDGDTVTCSGSGTGIVDDGLDEATITVEIGAVVTGTAQGFEFGDEVTFVNNGTITGTNDHGVQGDNDVVVVNTGTITGLDGDGVNIDNDGSVTNSGTISGSDDGVQMEDNATLINDGTITAVDEGVNANEDFADITNTGLISAGDDAINVANEALIFNSGTIRSTGAQDGVDMDSGTVFNSGLIESLGGEDGIDIDAGGTTASVITNTGTIRGALAINTDPADTQTQIVSNFGTLEGSSGIAVNLGDGDDSLVIGEGSVVEGAIEMGDGLDTLVVETPIALTFGASSPEIVTFSGGGIVTTAGLVAFDALPLTAADRSVQDLSFAASDIALDYAGHDGGWISAFATKSAYDDTDEMDAVDERGTGLVLGYGFTDRLSGFLSISRSTADIDQADDTVETRATLLGATYAASITPDIGYAISTYFGTTQTDIDTFASGDADFSGRVFGVGARVGGIFSEITDTMALDFMLQGDVVRFDADGFDLNALGAEIDDRTVTATAVSLEIGLPVQTNAAILRPYLEVTKFGGDQDDVSASALGATTSFDAADLQGGTKTTLGATFKSTQGGPNASLALTRDDESDSVFALTFGWSF